MPASLDAKSIRIARTAKTTDSANSTVPDETHRSIVARRSLLCSSVVSRQLLRNSVLPV